MTNLRSTLSPRSGCWRALFTAAFLLALLLGHTASALAQGNFVYVNNNLNPNNTVSAYAVGADCSLTPIAGSPFATGGTGDGGFFFTVNLAEVCGNNLYAANLGSNTLTVFAINPATGALTTVGSPVAVPGTGAMNISCTPDGRFLYVARAPSHTINVFSRAANGLLTSVQEVPSGGLNPLDIKVSPNGAFLLVSNSGSSTVIPFTINQADGTLTMGTLVQTAEGTSEIEINCAATLAFVGTAAGVHVYSIGAGGALTQVMGSPFNPVGDADANIQLSPDDRFLFVSHYSTNTMSVMSVAAGGTLTEIAGSPFANTGGNSPQPAVTNASGTCLFAFNSSVGATAFSIAADGSLARVGAPTGGSISNGGIAAYPAASCSVPDPITQLITQVQGMVTAGILSADQGAGLIDKLEGVLAKVNGGQTGAACNQLKAFINQVNGFISAGALSAEQGQALITAANNIKAQIGC